MKPATLRNHLLKFPKLPIRNLPSPLEPLPHLKTTLKTDTPSIWIKRDDEIGLGLGGNKGRKLAYLLADSMVKKKHKVVTFGGLQSNHVRMTAASSAALGLEAHLFFFDKKPARFTGNLMLNEIFGARMHFIPFAGGNSKALTLETTNRIVHLVSMLFTGPGTYFIPVGGHTTIGCLGYIEAACEIADQVSELGLEPQKTTIVSAAGTGGTLAGLMAGFSILESPIHVIGIDIGNLWKGFPNSIARLANNLCAKLGSNVGFHAGNVPLIERAYVGQGYAHPSKDGRQAIRQLAQTEGIILDPVYTGKAFAGMLDLVHKNRFNPDENLIFLHSGGFPALWS